MARKEQNIHVGDVVYIEVKEVEGIVTFSDPMARQVRIDDSDPERGTPNTQTNTMFYSWSECELVSSSAKEPEPQRGRRTPVAPVEAKVEDKGKAK